MRSAIAGCWRMTCHSSSSSGPALCRIASGIPIIPKLCSSAAVRIVVISCESRPSASATCAVRSTTDSGARRRTARAPRAPRPPRPPPGPASRARPELPAPSPGSGGDVPPRSSRATAGVCARASRSSVFSPRRTAATPPETETPSCPPASRRSARRGSARGRPAPRRPRSRGRAGGFVTARPADEVVRPGARGQQLPTPVRRRRRRRSRAPR